jgi:hypothetical protein
LRAEPLKERFLKSIEEVLVNRLKEYNNRISSFEAKYGMPFVEFALAWDNDRIPDKHSHEVEGDYMDWEALEMSKKKLLDTGFVKGLPF